MTRSYLIKRLVGHVVPGLNLLRWAVGFHSTRTLLGFFELSDQICKQLRKRYVCVDFVPYHYSATPYTNTTLLESKDIRSDIGCGTGNNSWGTRIWMSVSAHAQKSQSHEFQCRLLGEEKPAFSANRPSPRASEGVGRAGKRCV